MKNKMMALVALIPLLMLTACDTSQSSGTPDGSSNVQKDIAPDPANGYTEHVIFNDRYSSLKEVTYVSPVDGKSMVCTVYSSGTGAGNSCRIKGE